MLYVPVDENNFALIESISISEPLEGPWKPYLEGFDGLYKPKWNGTKWVEGLSAEELEEIKNRPLEPSERELMETRIKQLEEENADVWFELMHKEARIAEHDTEIASIWYEIMTGGV